MKTLYTMIALVMLVGLATTAPAQEAARESYREARNHLNDRDYARAAELFAEVADRYPDSREAPEALYWRAFALLREGDRADLLAARDALQMQLDRYPDEARDGDSEELAVRIRARLAEMGDSESAEEIQRLATQLGEESGRSREEETRLAALNALMQVNPERALPILRKVLVENPEKYSVDFRDRALFLVSQQGREDEAVDILLHVVRNDRSPQIRGQAVFWLSQTDSDRTLAILDSLLSDPNERDEVREKAIFAISQVGGPEASATLRRLAANPEIDMELRENAIFWIGQSGGRESTQFLIELYADLEEPELKEKVLFSVAQTGGRDAGDFLMGIVRDPEEDIEVRNNALFWLGQTDRIDEEELVAMIPTIDEPELAEQVVFVLSQRNSPAAIDALIQLASTADDPEVREKAIFWLGQSGDERAAQYLEDLIGEDW